MYDLLKPLLFRLDPEMAHRATIRLLKHLPLGLVPLSEKSTPALKTILWNRTFPNPVGLAAGFDKNAEAVAGLFQLGFGFVEAGTVTLKPQDGNPRPRVFREPMAEAVINRMGFPNCGAAAFKENITAFLSRRPRPNGILGINVGMNKDQTEPLRDYTALMRSLGPMADYVTINISSPNTPGLRNLQEPSALRELLTAVLEERHHTCGGHPPPLLVKLAPDLTDSQLADIAHVILDVGVDGVILSNTTLGRPETLPEHFRAEKGGLSGRPLTQDSTDIIYRFYALTHGKIPIIGVGGISSAQDAYDKIKAGASLVQIYSGMVFKGPTLPRQIIDGLESLLKADGYKHITEAIGQAHNTRGGTNALSA